MSDLVPKEVRLGLVCYGGVSLAIYMHGLTKEIYKLVRAARMFDRALEAGDLDPDRYYGDGAAGAAARGSLGYDSEPAYFAALAALAKAGHPVTVSVDVIAGTSAGGINGVCLARALAGGRSLEAFRELWLEDADMEKLLAGHALFPWGRGKLLSKMVESAARLGWHRRDGLLNGDLMCNMLHQALSGMEKVEEPLLGPADSLDLFVTATNVHGYDTVIPSGAGGISHTDRTYRQLMHFAYQKEPQPAERFTTDFSDVNALTFAARATASFPGAFAPVSIASMFRAIGTAGQDDTNAADNQITRHFVYESGYAASPDDQWFMDGGVLDNGPFDHVIEAIAAKRASGPTAREIIYLEPDPHAPADEDLAASGPQKADHWRNEPTFGGTVKASRITIPWNASLASVLDQLETINATISEVGKIVETARPEVIPELEKAAASALRGAASYDDVTSSAGTIKDTARQLAGDLGYQTYGRLRAQAVAESFGMTVAADLGFPSESNRANFVTAVLCAWARQQDSWMQADPKALDEQLGPVDVPFRLRRAEFILDAINQSFDDRPGGSQADLVAMKQACWALICELRAKQQSVAAMARLHASALFGPQALRSEGYLADPDRFARDNREKLADLYRACAEAVTRTGVAGTSQNLWTTLVNRTAAWPREEDRTQLLARYVGFPIWDSLIFPVIALAKLPQLTPIPVYRFSPRDATCLHAVDGKGNLRPGKLDGVAYHHFGGFFDRSWRENDYLWGRTDGAELVMRLLSRQSQSPLDLTGFLRSALISILDAEQDRLTQVKGVLGQLRTQAEGIEAGRLIEPTA